MTERLDPRVGELLSGLIDEAVTSEERLAAEAWLERSALARAEYRSLAQVKEAIGGLGAVEPPFGFYERMLRQGTPRAQVASAPGRGTGRGRSGWRSAGPMVFSLVASAAAFVFIAGGVNADRTLEPPIEEVTTGAADGVLSLRSGSGPMRALRQEADAIDWSSLPEGVRLDDDEAEIWRDLTTEGGEERIVVFRDGVVVTVAAENIVAGELIEEALELARENPASTDGVLNRARTAVEGLLDSLSLG